MLGDFITSYRTPEVIGIGLPSMSTIFDEMSHQDFFCDVGRDFFFGL